MANVEEIYERLINENFSVLKDVGAKIPQDMYNTLVEHLVAIFSRQLKLSPLLSWGVKHEVESINNCSDVLREDSVSKSLVNRILFDNVGIKYLRLLLNPVTKKIMAHDRSLEIDDPQKVGEKETTENLNVLLAAIDQFISTFQESEMSCPLIIRKVLMHINTNVTAKFKDESAKTFSLHFFFFQFVCLAMVKPEQYNIVDSAQMTESLHIGLSNASKILQDIVTQTIREDDSALYIEYKKKNGPVIQEVFNSLIDAKGIQTAERILLANTTAANVNPEQVQLLKDNFINFIMANNLDDLGSVSNYSESSYQDLESPETTMQLVEEFIHRLKNPAWTEKKKNKGLWTLKGKNENVFAVRIEFEIFAPLNFVSTYFQNNINSTKYEPTIFDNVITYQGKNYREMYFKMKCPFPLSNRDILMSEWLISPDANHTYLLLRGNKNYPRQPGFVRVKTGIHGFEFCNTQNPEVTKVRMIIDADPAGSMPKWFTSAVQKGQMDKMRKMKNTVEARFKNPSGSSASSFSSDHSQQ